MVTEDWYFVSHRLQLAKAAQSAGFEVVVVTSVGDDGDKIKNEGFKLISIKFSRASLAPAHEYRTYQKLCNIYREEQPDIVHHVALKPVIYGSFAAQECTNAKIINTLGGLGYIFSSSDLKAKFLRSMVKFVLRKSLGAKNSRLIVQNTDDQQRLIAANLVQENKVRLVRGSGVDPALYRPVNHDTDTPLVILPARLLKDKGVVEFVEAARELKAEGIQARFALVGKRDPANPACISEETEAEWKKSDIIELMGWQSDMPAIFEKAQIVCLPSYHEGLPKALLEAAASSCAIVATDISGCREIVQHELTGWLVPRYDVESLKEKLKIAISESETRKKYGATARARLEEKFSLNQIINETLAVYEEVLAD